MTDQTNPNDNNGRKLRERRRLIFSEKNVRTLPVRRKQYVVWDGGFGRGAGQVGQLRKRGERLR